MPAALLCGNWKMNGSRARVVQWSQSLRAGYDLDPWSSALKVWVAPPVPLIEPMKQALGPLPVAVGAQNMNEAESGPFTGEVSAAQLLEVGSSFCLVGHSERRHLYGESDERVARKTVAALEAGLTPIVCLGETLDERESDRTEAVVERQLRFAMARLTSSQAARVVIAYEPVWAIGTGRVAAPSQAEAVHQFLRGTLRGMPGHNHDSLPPLLYGGSVDPSNAAELARQPAVDGFLVGGASLQAESFRAIADALQETKSLI